MKVKELIKLLQNCDPELPVVIWDEEMQAYWEPSKVVATNKRQARILERPTWAYEYPISMLELK